MKTLTLNLLFLLLPVCLCAQSDLTGKVSASSGGLVMYCKLILAKDSVPFQTVNTDSLGNFRFSNLTAGNYQLRIKGPFKPVDTTVVVKGNTIFDFTIPEEGQIDEVVIRAKQPMIVRKVDRVLFNPADIPALVGGDASDVIEFAPGVYINGSTIQLSNGKQARVMLNDKLIPLEGTALISFIRSISTEDIQYIEIIPVPPVKYAASMNGGLINIKLVAGSKSKLSKGSINGGIGQRYYSQQDISANYAYRKGRFSLYTNADFGHSKYRPAGTKTIDFDTLQWNEKSTINYNNLDLRGSLGMNYELNSSTEIGVLAFVSLGTYEQNFESAVEKRIAVADSLVGLIHNQTLDIWDNRKNSVNLNLTKRLDSLGRKLDFNVDYTNYAKSDRINYDTKYGPEQTDSMNSQRNHLVTGAHFLSGGLDYVHPIGKMTWNAGLRYSYSNNRMDLSVFNNLLNPDVADTLKSNTFNYYEHIQAAYVSVDWKLNRWSFQVGLRGENTTYLGESPTAGAQTKNTYFQLVPKVFAMYETKKGNAWNFSYSRDFYRPGYDDLNPFRYYTSSYSYQMGNPMLKPSSNHSLSVSTGIRDFQLNVSFYYNLKGSSSVTIFDNATQTQQTTVANLLSYRSVFLYISYYKTIKKRISIDASLMGDFSNTTVTQTIAKQNLNNIMGMINLGLNFVLDKRESLTLNCTSFYMTPFYQQFTLKKEYPYMAFSLKKNLLKNRISLKLSISDPFRLMKAKSTMRSNQTVVKEDFYHDTRALWFSFTFKFGNNRLSVNEHRTNSTGEAGRAGNK